MKFAHDASQRKVLKTLEALVFQVVRTGNHIVHLRSNPDGTTTPLTMPNHPKLKGSTLRSICTQAGISREEFLRVYEQE
jgi:predicted RNA binding protein YcfA (HicA-like mRNA interferase family)